MLTLKVNGETYKGVNYSALIEVIQNNVSYDIINDEIEYTENVVREDNNGVLNDDLYDEYVGALELMYKNNLEGDMLEVVTDRKSYIKNKFQDFCIKKALEEV